MLRRACRGLGVGESSACRPIWFHRLPPLFSRIERTLAKSFTVEGHWMSGDADAHLYGNFRKKKEHGEIGRLPLGRNLTRDSYPPPLLCIKSRWIASEFSVGREREQRLYRQQAKRGSHNACHPHRSKQTLS